MTQGFAASRYAELETKREPYLNRARECAKLTIPTLFPPDGKSEGNAYPQPYQSMGARGLNNLASKLLLTLFPPNNPNFKLEVDDVTREIMTKDQAFKGEVDEVFNVYERAVTTDTEGKTTRPKLFEALKQLVCGGNTLLFLESDGPPRVYRLDSYVVNRDPMGKVLEIITKESIAFRALDKKMQKQVEEQIAKDQDTPDEKEKTSNQPVDLYTYIWLEDGRYKITQEIAGITVPNSGGSYKPETLPWLPLRFISIDGESYGRGYIEEYWGDLNALEVLQKAVLGVSSVLAKVVFLIKPGSPLRPDKFAKAENGDALSGNPEDVGTVQADKLPELRAGIEVMNKLEQRLSFAFLLNTAIQRSGERVTAEEIRYMAGELEDALGGIYSVLSQDLQLPFVRVKLDQLTHLPPLPKEVTPVIVTGVDALGRGHDLMRLDAFIDGPLQRFGPEAMQYLHIDEYLARRAAALGVDRKGLVKTQQEVMAEVQQQQAAQLAERVGPNVANKVGDAMIKSQETQ